MRLNIQFLNMVLLFLWTFCNTWTLDVKKSDRYVQYVVAKVQVAYLYYY